MKTPLLFDLSVDVGQETPLVPGSALHTKALAAIQSAVQAMSASLHDGKLQSVPNYKADLSQKLDKKLVATLATLFVGATSCHSAATPAVHRPPGLVRAHPRNPSARALHLALLEVPVNSTVNRGLNSPGLSPGWWLLRYVRNHSDAAPKQATSACAFFLRTRNSRK